MSDQLNSTQDVTESQEPDEEIATIQVTEPRDGLPEIVSTPEQLSKLVSAISAGQGPVALDAERASGFKYSQRA
jgi:ribonuclease D